MTSYNPELASRVLLRLRILQLADPRSAEGTSSLDVLKRSTVILC